MEHGLIGKLMDYLKSIHIIRSQKEFTSILFFSENYSIHPTELSSLTKYDFYTPSHSETLMTTFSKEYKNYIDNLDRVFSLLSDSQKIDLNKFLLDTVKMAGKYAKISKPSTSPEDWSYYDKEVKKSLVSFYEQNKNKPSMLSYNVFLYIRLSVDKSLSPYFSLGPKYLDDLNEFSKCVLCQYGVISDPGKRAVLDLAFKSDGSHNIFALCEYGDMLYYGLTTGGEPNYAKALEIYEMAAGVKDVKGLEGVHPLALFSISFIYFNYHRRGFLKNVSRIDRLEEFTDIQRIEFAIKYSEMSLDFMRSGAPYNTLGTISNYLSAKLRKKYGLKPALYYYKKAAEYNYIYAYNNIAVMEAGLIDTEPAKANQHVKNYIKQLNLSSNLHEPWATNRLGLFYLHGTINGCSRAFPEMVDLELAKSYFLKATQYHIDRNSAWAVANLMVFFPSVYNENPEYLLPHITICFEKGENELFDFLSKSLLIDVKMLLQNYENICKSKFYDFKKLIVQHFEKQFPLTSFEDCVK